MAKFATISDVAREAGVSKTAVTLAMHHREGLSDATRERILDTARRLHYRPAPTRQTRGNRRAGQIVALFSSPILPAENLPESAYLHDLARGIEAGASSGLSNMVLSSVSIAAMNTNGLPAILERSDADGAVVRSWEARVIANRLRKLGHPFVLVDCDEIVEDAHQLQIDHEPAMHALVDHLVGRGCKHFATITGDVEHLNARERLEGLRGGLAEHKLDPPVVVKEQGFLPDSGLRGVKKLLDDGVSFDALVCQSDLIAAGALQALNKAGIAVPRQVKVTGFDNLALGALLAPGLTTVDPHLYALGEAAAQWLLQITGDPSSSPPRLRRWPATLIRRGSTASG
ncbi:MAG: LacI family transcriptional regulator [Candidatus Pacebacteria bacterium]|nr:LacI family transcriptional regulator [Candidatus Paceibacterota bacterium]